MAFPDIQVVIIDQVTRRASFGIRPKKLTGLAKLIQIVVLSLMNNPGRSVLDPERGGGLPDLIGRNFDPDDPTELFADIAQSVKRTQSEIIQAQIGLNEDDEGKLRELKIVGVTPGADIDEVLVTLKIVNEAGQSTDVVL